MSVEKIILRSFLNTLLAIFILLVFMVGMLVAVYPETMMNISYDMGMEKASIWFAERAYDRHDKIDTIAFATSVAIEENMYGKVVSCGEKMIADDEFAEYCDRKNEENKKKFEGQENILTILGDYDQYVYAQVSLAQYKTGDKDGAVDRAVNAIELAEDFPKNNAVVWLLVEADANGDDTVVSELIAEMDALDQSSWTNVDYYVQIREAALA